jgi:nucleoside-diphosphate-sugar epimerase
MRVLAIGATGFIGRHVLGLVVAQGHEVAVFRRGNTVLGLPKGLREIHGNRDRLGDSQTELRQFAPDVVLDMILYTEEQARELVRTFRDTGGRVVAVSSADVYRNYDGFRRKATAPPDPVPLSEDAPLRETRYPYRGESLPFEYARDYEKILVEQVLLSDPLLPATVLRLPAVYGPGDRQHRLQPYLRRMSSEGSRILLAEGQASWRWTRGYVENVAAALAFVVTDPHSVHRVYNVGDELTFTERGWIERIGALAGWEGNVVPVPQAELPYDLRQPFDWRYDLWTDTRAMRSELGYVQPVPLDDALRRTVDWESSELDGPDR